MEEILASIRKIIADDKDPAAAAAEAQGEVLELTQMVQDDGSVVDLNQPATPPEVPPMPPPPEPPAAPAKQPDALVSEKVASAAVSSLSSLASTVEIEKLASMQTETFIGNGARTLEGMVMELMKPMLREWLDKNLPAIVDRLVQKEIERISRKAQD